VVPKLGLLSLPSLVLLDFSFFCLLLDQPLLMSPVLRVIYLVLPETGIPKLIRLLKWMSFATPVKVTKLLVLKELQLNKSPSMILQFLINLSNKLLLTPPRSSWFLMSTTSQTLSMLLVDSTSSQPLPPPSTLPIQSSLTPLVVKPLVLLLSVQFGV
jgi:hypothetical protein